VEFARRPAFSRERLSIFFGTEPGKKRNPEFLFPRKCPEQWRGSSFNEISCPACSFFWQSKGKKIGGRKKNPLEDSANKERVF
jgi:hypothetical protein